MPADLPAASERLRGDLGKPALRDAVRRALARCGLAWPEVAIRAVTSIERHAETGKVLRFVPSQA